MSQDAARKACQTYGAASREWRGVSGVYDWEKSRGLVSSVAIDATEGSWAREHVLPLASYISSCILVT
jgi:lipid-binding SYLF domain-containing protein